MSMPTAFRLEVSFVTGSARRARLPRRATIDPRAALIPLPGLAISGSGKDDGFSH